MTRLEFEDIIALMKSLWGKWTPSEELVSVFFEEFGRYDADDLKKAVLRYRAHTNRESPTTNELRPKLDGIILERRAEEKKVPGAEDIRLHYLIVKYDSAGKEIDYKDFWGKGFPSMELLSRSAERSRARCERIYGGNWTIFEGNETVLLQKIKDVQRMWAQEYSEELARRPAPEPIQEPEPIVPDNESTTIDEEPKPEPKPEPTVKKVPFVNAPWLDEELPF